MTSISSGQITDAQLNEFRTNGYVVLPEAVTAAELRELLEQLATWIEESRLHSANYGQCIDGRPRFDLEAGHCAATPRLRRVNNPAEVSEVYRKVAFEARIADYAAELIAPNIKFYHCKVNLKQSKSTTRVGYHQDFSYAPHTNLDVVSALLLLHDMTPSNGCLKVVPGSHLEGQVSLWHGGRFTGEVDTVLVNEFERRAENILAPAGSVCVMHSLLMHGSDANQTDLPRALFICCYSAADAFPLSAVSLPNKFLGTIVRGRPSNTARLTDMKVELPDNWRATSFFEVQGQKSASGS